MLERLVAANSDTAGPDVTPGVNSARPQGSWRRFHLGALLAHLGFSSFFTWPLLLNFLPGRTNLVPGSLIVDRDQNLWNLWWVGHALAQGHDPFVSDFIWYPTPVSLHFHTLNVFNGLLAWPLLGFLSLTTIYNMIVLFSFVAGGYGAFLLVYYLCKNHWAALVGSVVFAYSAYHIATMRGLLQLISLEWFPFFVLFLLRAVAAPLWLSRRDFSLWLVRSALPASLFLLLVSLVDWYYTMYGLMFAALLAFYFALRYVCAARFTASRSGDLLTNTVRRGVLEPLLRINLCIAIYLVLVSPLLVPTIAELQMAKGVLPAADATLSNSADLLAFFEPPRDSQLLGGAVTNRQKWPFSGNKYEVYFTYTALLLGGCAIVGTRKLRSQHVASETERKRGLLPGKWFWAGAFVVFFLLALGPVLQVNGQQISGVPMPYSLIERLPVLNISRSPDRFDMPLTLCLGVLVGMGINRLASSRIFGGASRSGPVVAILAVLLIVIELSPMPYIQRPDETPRWYTPLAKEPGDFSILELPPQDDYWHGAFRMYDATAHGKRIFGGYLSREYSHPFLTSTPGYSDLMSSDTNGDIFDAGPPEWYSAFELYSTRYVVLQKVRLPEVAEPPVDVSASRAAISRVLRGDTPIYEDEQLAAYRVPLPGKMVPFLSLGDGWEPRETGPNGTFRWMASAATLNADLPEESKIYLTFRSTVLGSARPIDIFVGERPIFTGEVGALAGYKVGPFNLPKGKNLLRIVSPTGTTSPVALGQGTDKRELSFAFLNVKLEIAP